MPQKNTFANCRCPHCKQPLDEVSIEATACPSCNQALDPTAVWRTRKYAGILTLPWWVALFIWPTLLMTAGAVVLWQRYIALGRFSRHDVGEYLGTLLLAAGLGWFIIKAAMKGDE